MRKARDEAKTELALAAKRIMLAIQRVELDACRDMAQHLGSLAYCEGWLDGWSRAMYMLGNKTADATSACGILESAIKTVGRTGMGMMTGQAETDGLGRLKPAMLGAFAIEERRGRMQAAIEILNLASEALVSAGIPIPPPEISI